MDKKRKTKKFLGRAALTCAALLAVTSTFGMFAACNSDTTDDGDDDDTVTSSNPDSQLIKNGNFEFYDDNDGVYLISSPNSWSRTATGTSSAVMSGIINTKPTAWKAMTDPELAATLDYNNELVDKKNDDDATDEDKENYEEYYVDYNGMESDDILYKNVKAATEDDATDNDKALIDNPLTHNIIEQDTDGAYYYMDGSEKVNLYKNEDGDFFLDEDFEEPFESSVLMVHNYLKNGKGTGQYYGASTSLTLEANTAATLSVWVKTSDLLYDGGQAVTQSRGAFIEVTQSVGSTTLDSFKIKYINTGKLNPKPDDENTDWLNNGWVQYNIYIQACDFASTTIKVNLGLGEEDGYAVEGYAFFDDLVCKKYKSIEDVTLPTLATDDSGKYLSKEDGGTYCDLMSEGNDKVFEADTYTVITETGEHVEDRFSESFDYYIDLNSTTEKLPVQLNANNTEMGLTVDTDKYTVGGSAPTVIGAKATSIGTEGTDYYVNSKINGINTNEDILANIDVANETEFTNALGSHKYFELLKDKLTSAKDLPQVGANANTVIMLSAMGAPYTAKIDNGGNAFTIAAEEYRVFSVWVKTSNMNGYTAATINLIDANNDANVATLSIDTTGLEVNVDDDNKDIYNGWVECFFFIHNDTEEEQSYTIELKFGNTVIKGTTLSSYNYGWAAFTNMRTLTVDEDEYAYFTGANAAHTSSLSFSETDNRSNNNFTTAISDDDIKTNITKPSTYEGVNGESATVVNGDKFSSYNYTDKNAYAGLVNVDAFNDYIDALAGGNTEDYAWLAQLLAINGTSASEAATKADEVWTEIFGAKSVQPLLIVDTLRTYAEKQALDAESFALGTYYYFDAEDNCYVKATTFEEGKTYYNLMQAINYGYVGSSATVSSNSYTAVSVKVKVEGDRKAYIYLADDTTREVLEYTTPKYTFWYDEVGNVLKAEPNEDDENYDAKANIAYTSDDSGLYTLDGKYYANLYNLEREYYKEGVNYYNAAGDLLTIDQIEQNEIYYANAEMTAYQAHRLVTSDGNRAYEYTGTGVGANAEYYYCVNGAADKNYVVKTFDTTVATPRYTEISGAEYYYEIGDTNGEWVTVNFFIHTGSASKNYRLELWSGERDENGVTTSLGDTVKVVEELNSYVVFDYSYVSLSETTYTALLNEYLDEINTKYIEALANVDGALAEIDGKNYSLADLERLAEEKLSEGEVQKLKTYTAHYYNYTLYDASDYLPFNELEADEGDTGYDYDINDFEEKLAYFKLDNDETKTTFIDYSAVDQSITRVDVDAEEDEEEETEDDEDATNVFLLISSIVLVVAVFAALATMLGREIYKAIKKKRGTKADKVGYSKAKRYIKQYTKANGEIKIPEENNEDTDSE